MNDKIIEIAHKHNLIIDSFELREKQIIVASKADFIACVSEILATSIKDETFTEKDIVGLM